MPEWGARAAVLGPAVGRTRGERFALRRRGEAPAAFTDLLKIPAWLVGPEEKRERLAAAVAVLHHRPAIDGELRGQVLGPVAALTGEALFDALCATPGVDGAPDRPLPPPGELSGAGERLLRDSLPPSLGGREDDYALALVTAAEAVMAEEVPA